MKTIQVVAGQVFAVNESERPSFVDVLSDVTGGDVGTRMVLEAGDEKPVICRNGGTVTIGSGVRLERRTAEGVIVLGHG